MSLNVFNALAFIVMLTSFEYVAAIIVQRIDERGTWTRIAARSGEPVDPNSIGNRILLRIQRTAVFTAAALTAVVLNAALNLILKQV